MRIIVQYFSQYFVYFWYESLLFVTARDPGVCCVFVGNSLGMTTIYLDNSIFSWLCTLNVSVKEQTFLTPARSTQITGIVRISPRMWNNSTIFCHIRGGTNPVILLFSSVRRLRCRGLPWPHLSLLRELCSGSGLRAGEKNLWESQEAHVSIITDWYQEFLDS